MLLQKTVYLNQKYHMQRSRPEIRDAPIANFGADRRNQYRPIPIANPIKWADLLFKVMFKTQLMGLIHWRFHKQQTT